MLRASDEQADRVLCRRDDRRLGRVRDHDAAACRRLDVDVVDTDARASDHLQLDGAVDELGGQLRRGADDDRVVEADDVRQFAVEVDVDVEPGAEQVDAGVGDRLAHQDLHHATFACS